MINSVTFTRRGRIKQLKIIKSLVSIVDGIYENVILNFEPSEIEVEDSDEIRRSLNILMVSIDNAIRNCESENHELDGPMFDAFHFGENRTSKCPIKKFQANVSELKRIAISLCNPNAKGGIEKCRLPVVFPEHVNRLPHVDYKMMAAGDDTCVKHGEEGDDE